MRLGTLLTMILVVVARLPAQTSAASPDIVTRMAKEKSVRQMITIQTGDLKTGFTSGNGWGLTWCVVKEPQGITAMLSPGTHGHGGAYGTQAWIDPVKGVTLILMVQRSNFGNSDGSAVRLAFQQAAMGG